MLGLLRILDQNYTAGGGGELENILIHKLIHKTLIINCLLGGENIYLFLAVNKKTVFSLFLKTKQN